MRYAEGNLQVRLSAVRQDRMSTSRYLHVDEIAAHRIQGQAMLDAVQRRRDEERWVRYQRLLHEQQGEFVASLAGGGRVRGRTSRSDFMDGDGAHSTFESSQSDLDTRSSSQVSFRPPFYSCQGCHPEQVSDSFSTRYSAWYDDDYISTTGQKRVYSSNSNNDQGGANDDQGGGDDADDAVSAQTDDGGTAYYQQNDDYYSYAGTDDASNGNDDAATATDDANANDYEVNTDDKVNYNYKQHDDDFYSLNDDNRRGLRTLQGRAVVPFDSGLSLTARETRTVSFVGGVNPKTRSIPNSTIQFHPLSPRASAFPGIRGRFSGGDVAHPTSARGRFQRRQFIPIVEYVPAPAQIRHVVQFPVSGPRYLPRRRMEPLGRIPAGHNVRVHGCDDAPRIREEGQGIRTGGHVGGRAWRSQSRTAPRGHAHAIRDRVHDRGGTGGREVRERDAGIRGRDVRPALPVHAQADVVRESEAGVPTGEE